MIRPATECGTIVDIDEFPARPTLREALIYANSTPGAETITFASYLSGRTLTLAERGPTTTPIPTPSRGCVGATSPWTGT